MKVFFFVIRVACVFFNAVLNVCIYLYGGLIDLLFLLRENSI